MAPLAAGLLLLGTLALSTGVGLCYASGRATSISLLVAEAIIAVFAWRWYQDQQAKKGQLKAILVKAGKWQTKEELLALIEPFKFEGHGSEAREKAQLAGMGWKPYEAGKFYNEWDHLWYFLAYGGQGGKVISQAMKAALDKKMYGDVVVVKSAPAGGKFSEQLSCEEVADAIIFLSTTKPQKLFSEREMQCMFSGMLVGAHAAGMSGVRHLHLKI